jgi:outer membrane lipoprotein-sorting protein
VPALDRKLLAKGKLGLSWKVTDAGPGVRQWVVSSLTVGQKGAHWVTRAKGASKSATTIALPKGHAYKLRFAITDASGQTSTVALGKVKVPKAARPDRR